MASATTATTRSAADSGELTKVSGLPSEMISACRSFSSSSRPSTKPSASGAVRSQACRGRSRPGRRPPPSRSATGSFEIEKSPMQQKTTMAGNSSRYGTCSSFTHKPDQRQVDDDQHQVADPHGGDKAPEQFRVALDHLRAGQDALDHHGAHHQRHHGVRRQAQGQKRDEAGLRAGVVGRFRPGDGRRARRVPNSSGVFDRRFSTA